MSNPLFNDGSIDWENLPEPTVEDNLTDDPDTNDVDFTDGDNEPSLDTAPPDGAVADKICDGCKQPIYRQPGSRGRLPKYHPQCRPATRSQASTRGTKALQAENEVELAVANIRKKLMQLAMIVALADKYDGFVIAMAVPDICSNISDILTADEKVRRWVLGVGGKGGWLGLILCVIGVILPIMANHKLIPIKFLRELLLNFPKIMHKLNIELENGPANLAKIMFEQLETNKAAAKPKPTDIQGAS